MDDERVPLLNPDFGQIEEAAEVNPDLDPIMVELLDLNNFEDGWRVSH